MFALEPLKNMLRKSSGAPGLGAIFEAGEILDCWPELAGKEIAAKTKPLLIRDGVLLVKTLNSTWSHQLTLLKPRLLQRLREAGHPLKDIRFTTGPIQTEEKKRGQQETTPKNPNPDYSLVPADIEKARLREAIASFLGEKKKPRERKPDKHDPPGVVK